jgi:Cohesin domain
MKRWQWVSLVVFAGLVAAVVAVLPFGGQTKTSADVSTGTAHLELDMVQDAGGSWCNPINTSTTHTQGETYKVAVCASDFISATSVGGFQFELNYDAQLNDCVDTAEGNGFDSNPDANLGSTLFTGTEAITANGLGTGWNCNLGGVAPPTCSNLSGNAFLQCNTVTGTTELPHGSGVSEPIALVTFHAQAGGIDNLTLLNAEVDDADVSAIIDCFINPTTQCFGAEDSKTGEAPATPTVTNTPAPPTATREACGPNERFTCTPTPRPFTRTPTPGPTATTAPPTEQPPPPPPPPPPSGGEGPTVIPPATGEGSSVPWGAPVAGTIVAIAAVSLITGGLYVRLARKR